MDLRFLIVTLSGTGNTAWAAARFSDAARELGHRVDAASAREALGMGPGPLGDALRETDLLLLAYPIYGADFPPAIKRLLARIAALGAEPRPAACLCTMGYVDAQGPFAAARALARSHLALRGYLPILMSNNVSVPGLRADPAPPERIAARKAAARLAIPAFAAALGSGRRAWHGIGPYLIPGPLIRRATARRLARPALLWAWDAGRCRRCGLCVDECPMGCLSFGDSGLVFGEDCSYCARCYNRCPEAAILPEGRYADPRLYRRYLCPPD